MNEQKISVLVANFNHKQYIKQAVVSILNQTYENFEIIIIDDKSNDGSVDIINDLVKLDKRIVEPIFLPQNKGKWFALNRGISNRATGVLLTCQDADDTSCKQRLEFQYKTLIKNSSYHNLCGFNNCSSQEEIDKATSMVIDVEEPNISDVIPHQMVTQNVHIGFKTNGINHYYVGANFETHGASALFYKQFWDYGMKFMPGNLGLRCQKAEDSDMNTKLTLLLQKTSVLKMPLYNYRRGTTTNPAFLEQL